MRTCPGLTPDMSVPSAATRTLYGVGGLSSALLLLIFLGGAAATWAAGVALSRSTDALDARLGIGDDLGGLILLSVAGSLPELAITVSACLQGNLKLAAGNLIGGIAIQTMVLLICDFAVGPQRPLTYLIGRLTPVLEGLLVIILVGLVDMGSLLKTSTAIAGRINPASLGIVVVWVVGLYVINRAAKNPRWKIEMPGAEPGRRRRERAHPTQPHPYASWTTARVAILFGVASAVTLGAGVMLEQSGNDLANRIGLNGVIFGATVLATASALPEISSGVAAVALGDNALAMGDILGGNAFQVCLFLVADLVAGKPVLEAAGRQNAWLAALGVALTAIYGIRGDQPAGPLSPATWSGLAARPGRVRLRHSRALLRSDLVGGLDAPTIGRHGCERAASAAADRRRAPPSTRRSTSRRSSTSSRTRSPERSQRGRLLRLPLRRHRRRARPPRDARDAARRDDAPAAAPRRRGDHRHRRRRAPAR